MLISCKCLNFIATSNSQQQQHLHQQQQKSNSNAAVAPTADSAAPPTSATSLAFDEDCSMSSTGSGGYANNVCTPLATALMHAFLQKYPRNFPFYSQCMDFFKQSIGPIPDLAINAVNQRDLVYSLTLDIQHQAINGNNNNVINTTNNGQNQAWQISICINCNTALCAKRIGGVVSNPQTPEIGGNIQAPIFQQQYLINCSLLTNNEELMQRRSDKSFSETFGILIMDHPQLENGHNGAQLQQHPHNNFSMGGSFSVGVQQRLRQMQHNLQTRLQKEIADTDERIQRYTEQQFALLKSFREKSEQEYRLLVNLIQRVPEQCELLDQAPPALDVNGGAIGIGASSYAQRRRNTIGSRRDLHVAQPTTPTTTLLTLLPNFTAAIQTPAASLSSNSSQGAINTTANTQLKTLTLSQNASLGGNGNANGSASNISNNRKMSNFDTPPATPEATPMSVGNSPTFRQQQQQQQKQQNNISFGGRLTTTNSFQQQFPTPTTEAAADDYLFELEDVDGQDGASSALGYQQHVPVALHSNINHQLNHQLNYQRNQHKMDNLNESDSAEEAEDALLDLDSSMPIPMDARRYQTSNMSNFGKSLPIEIANSPLAERTIIADSDEDELDNTVDIAASIKALAKSVHGEAVFGDLPRPRMRSQI